MENKNIYLALVNKDFELTEEVVQYFQSRNIDVVGYMENIGVLKLRCSKEPIPENLRYISHIEKDQSFRTNFKED